MKHLIDRLVCLLMGHEWRVSSWTEISEWQVVWEYTCKHCGKMRSTNDR